MNISLPDPLKSFVDEQVKERGYGTSSEYVRALIRKDQERTRLRAILIEGAHLSPSALPMAPISTACVTVSGAAAAGENPLSWDVVRGSWVETQNR